MLGSANALILARSTGRPVPIPGGNGMVAYPNGSVGTPGGGFGGAGQPALPIPPIPPAVMPASVQPVAPSAPFSAAGVPGLPGSPSGPAVYPPQVQPPLNQANPNTTYVSPNTPQPTGAAPVVGQTGTQSGQPPVNPELVVTAQRYRAQHGLATQDDTDALNAESLAAAQAGRNYFNPTLAAQYGQPQAPGAYGPRTDVTNALTMPPATVQQPPVMLAQNNLLQRGLYQ